MEPFDGQETKLLHELEPGQRYELVLTSPTGMARYRKPLQVELGIPVVEPSQAAVGMAIARVRLNWQGA